MPGDGDRDVIAALALERQRVAQLGEQLRRPRARANHRMIAGVGAILAAHRAHAIALDLDRHDAIANDLPAMPREIRRDGGDLPIRIDRHALIRREHADRVVGPDLRLEREDAVAVEPLDAQAMFLAQLPGHRILREPLLVGIEIELAGAPHDVGSADLVQDFDMLLDRIGQQRRQRLARCAAPHRAAPRARTASATARPLADSSAGYAAAPPDRTACSARRASRPASPAARRCRSSRRRHCRRSSHAPARRGRSASRSAPRRSKCQAAHTPTMPAPITTTVSRPFPLISVRRLQRALHLGDQCGRRRIERRDQFLHRLAVDGFGVEAELAAPRPRRPDPSSSP